VVLQQHRNGSLETIAEMAEDCCAKLMRSGGVAAVLTVTFHLTSGSWNEGCALPSAKDYALTSASKPCPRDRSRFGIRSNQPLR
jgi:hypothetical protein